MLASGGALQRARLTSPEPRLQPGAQVEERACFQELQVVVVVRRYPWRKGRMEALDFRLCGLGAETVGTPLPVIIVPAIATWACPLWRDEVGIGLVETLEKAPPLTGRPAAPTPAEQQFWSATTLRHGVLPACHARCTKSSSNE
jgi:hypothetical protein